MHASLVDLLIELLAAHHMAGWLPPLIVAADFVRLAARCGAIIVPFAAVGADDAYDVMMDVDEVLDAPVLGDLVRVSSSGSSHFFNMLVLL